MIDKKELSSQELANSSVIKKNRNNKNQGRSVIILALAIIMGAVSFFLITKVINDGANALMDSYHNTYNSEKEDAYQKQYEKYFDKAEKEHHVRNRISINIGNLREIANLEVLKVSDVEYIIEKSDNNKEKITSWIEVPGEGIYIVNLQAAEFLIDDERSFIRVRAPYPELTNITIDYKNVQKLLFKNALLDNSYSVGEDLAREQLRTADILIKKEFASNQNFYLNAQKAAKSSIEYLIRQLNPSVSDLDVEIEFF